MRTPNEILNLKFKMEYPKRRAACQEMKLADKIRKQKGPQQSLQPFEV
jgi:hypothetical protein